MTYDPSDVSDGVSHTKEPSPVDPTPDWWPFLPSTGPTIPVDPETFLLGTTDDARTAAADLGRIHGEKRDALERLAADNGGGLIGMARGMLAEYERRGFVTSADTRRILEVLDTFAHETETSGVEHILRLHQECLDDEASMPLALMVTSVAADAATRSARDSAFTEGFNAGFADAVAVLPGAFLLPPFGTAAVVYTASTVAQHTHVNVTWE